MTTPIFYINMEKHVDRKTFIEEQCNRFSLVCIRQNGVDGRSLTEKELETLSPKETSISLNKKELLPGEVGCALSHREIYEKMIEQSIPYAVIIEDDVTLPKEFKTIVEDLVKKHAHNPSWDYIAFDYTEPGIPYLLFWLRSIKIRTSQIPYTKRIPLMLVACIKFIYILPLSFFEGLRNYYKKWNPSPVIFLRPLYLAGCYLITLNTAKILRDINTPIVYPADKVQNQARIKKGLKLRAYAPKIVGQEKLRFGSIITGKSGKDL
jgi:GR25 family glycosyltransferase involved in LPS biosynthesis